MILSSLGMRALSQYSSLRDISAYCPSTTLVILNGPVPEGFFANSDHFPPTASHCAGLAISSLVSRYGRKLNGYFVVRTTVLSSAFSKVSIIETVARTIGAAGASYCGDLSSYIRRKFQITASALKSDPSWNFTPSRTVQIQRVGLVSSACHAVNNPGVISANLSVWVKSQFTTES